MRPGCVLDGSGISAAAHRCLGVRGGYALDPVMRMVPRERRRTLVAHASESGYRFDIARQGEHETVFFDRWLRRRR